MAEHYGNTPRITYEFPDCSMPMAFDTYNNCSFGCMYCFAQNQRGIGSKKKEYLNKEVKDVSVERIKRMFIDPDKHAGDFAPYIKARKVMQWGSMGDQFDNFERKYGTTLELLRFFKDIDYPLCFSTKGAWFTKDERYMDLIRGQKNWNFKFSIITSDAEKARVIERGVESPQARLEAIERIANAGAGGATLRLRPFIIGVSTPTYLDLIKEAFNRGATALSTEFFCLETRSPTLREFFLRAKLDKAMNMGTREKSSKYYTMSAADYMKWCWNNPQAAHSPYKMFEGAMIPADERDSEGNIVYKYNGAKF